jgi:hypothetical protein
MVTAFHTHANPASHRFLDARDAVAVPFRTPALPHRKAFLPRML